MPVDSEDTPRSPRSPNSPRYMFGFKKAKTEHIFTFQTYNQDLIPPDWK